jgi:hypothetical protein
LRVGVAAAASGAGAGASAAAAARAAVALAASFSRQHCLYFLPEPQWQGSLRPGRELVCEIIGIECTVSLNLSPGRLAASPCRLARGRRFPSRAATGFKRGPSTTGAHGPSRTKDDMPDHAAKDTDEDAALRAQTDASLRTERAQTDRALAERHRTSCRMP